MKKKRLFTFLILLSLSLLVYGNELERQVVIVHPNNVREQSQIKNDIAHWLKKTMGDSVSEEYRSIQSSGSGSVIESRGELFVVTNAHVVAEAESATIEIPSQNHPKRERVEYRDLPIVYRAYSNDLAFLLLPPEAGEELKPLPLKTKFEVGERVFAAGYPWKDSTPSWRVTEGEITEINTKSDFFGVDTSAVIEHSAALSPGNSGGPLLQLVAEEYRLVGINTWYVEDSAEADSKRSYVSLPARSVARNLTRYFEQKNHTEKVTKKELAKQLGVFLQTLIHYSEIEKGNDNNSSLVMIQAKDIFTLPYVLDNGWVRFLDYLEKVKSHNRSNYIIKHFLTGNTYAVLSTATFYSVAEKFISSEGEPPTIKDVRFEKDFKEVSFSFFTKDQEEYATTWKLSEGYWRLAALSLEPTNRIITPDSGSFFGMSVGGINNFVPPESRFGLGFGFSWGWIFDYLLYEMELGIYYTLGINPTNNNSSLINFSGETGATYQSTNQIILNIRYDNLIGGHLPFRFGNQHFLIAPELKTGVSVGLLSLAIPSRFPSTSVRMPEGAGKGVSLLYASIPFIAGLEFAHSRRRVNFLYRIGFTFRYDLLLLYGNEEDDYLRKMNPYTFSLYFRLRQ